jgi:periodic tryptophan protein 1
MISSLCWVRKGASKTPERIELNDEEYARIEKQIGVQLETPMEEMQVDGPETDGMQVEKQTDNLAIYNLDTYDDDDTAEPTSVSLFSNVKGLAYYENGEKDPYINFEDDPEEYELEIQETDNLILAGKTEDDVSYLEIYVYEEQEDNLYVHRDIMLPSFPLCLEWLDFPVGRKQGTTEFGNFVAIGTFDPQVEIWDMDALDAVFPECILGQIPDPSLYLTKTKKKSGPARVAKRPQAERHVDAVMSICWNRNKRNCIATGSADATVKIWDLERSEKAFVNLTHHTNKVQAVNWNSKDIHSIATGGYDQKVFCCDIRSPESNRSWNLASDVECLDWDPFNSERFMVSTEDGLVQCFDIRADKPLFSIHAHDGAVSALHYNPHVKDCLVTGASDKKVKIWSLKNQKPSNVLSKDVGAVNIFYSG